MVSFTDDNTPNKSIRSPVSLRDGDGKVVANLHPGEGFGAFCVLYDPAGNAVGSLRFNPAGQPYLELLHAGEVMASISLDENGLPEALGRTADGAVSFMFSAAGRGLEPETGRDSKTPQTGPEGL